jgi:asparagine synthase (glutamine-hydrolysing)
MMNIEVIPIMCGIVGYFNLGLKREDGLMLLHHMCETIAHRGPDDNGFYANEWVGLGIQRLSIIDLVSGHQPVQNEDGSKQIIFNGEIYNFRELRFKLQEEGHRFLTASDTEVILHQYEEDGKDGVNHLNGMFAFAIWDQRKQSLFIVRDRMGIKPLYYYWDGQKFFFASEIKALLSTPLVKRQLNLQALWDYLTFRYIPQPETIWTNIYKLLPGHYLTISLDKPKPEIECYWDIPYHDDITVKSEGEYFEEFESLFLDAVRLHLIADVPVGVLLSGGLDSSSVAAAIAEVHNSQLSSFSVAFQDSPSINELPFARKVASRVGTDHHEIVIGEKEFCDFLPKFIRLTDEPLADLASVPLYYVSHLARQKVKVVLSGEGGDEILGGYHLDVTVRGWDKICQFQHLPRWLRESILPWVAQIFGRKIKEHIKKANIPIDQRLTLYPDNMTNYLTSTEKQTLFREILPLKDSFSIIKDEISRLPTRIPLHQLLYIYCQSWLVEDLLMKADKMTMANSIELRVPFLDHRIVEWAAGTPAWVKVGRNNLGAYETKRVLRNFARARLPEEILRRPKQGFPVPVYDWLKSVLKSYATEMLTSPDTKIYRWLKPEEIRRQLDRGTHNKSSLIERHRLWNLLILELWAREWKAQ